METDHAYLKDRELRRIHGGAVDDLQTLELALEAAKGVTEICRQEICRDLGVVAGSPPTTKISSLPKPREAAKAFDPIEDTASYESTFNEMAEIFEQPSMRRMLSKENKGIIREAARGMNGADAKVP